MPKRPVKGEGTSGGWARSRGAGAGRGRRVGKARVAWPSWLLLLLAWASGGCKEAPPVESGVLFVVEGDALVRERVVRVEVRVEGRGAEGDWEEAGHFELDGLDPLRWPLRGALEPKGAAPGRTFQVTVEGYDSPERREGMAPLVQARVRSEFVEGEWRRLQVFLAAACFDVSCAAEESCRLGVCVPAERQTEVLGEEPDAPAPSCERDAECDDGEPCTVDRCVQGRCVGVRPGDGSLAFRSVAVGQYSSGGRKAAYTCAVDVLNRLWCWGSNDKRQLGLDHNVGRLEPVRVEYIEGDVRQVSLGGTAGCAVLFDGGLWCWGENDTYRLLGDRPGRFLQPAQMPGLAGERVEQVAVGLVAACARLEDGEVRCWGHGAYGALGEARWGENSPDPQPVPGLPRAVDLAAGAFHMGLIDEDGVPWRWGAELTRDARSFYPVIQKMDTLLSPAVQLSMSGYSMCMTGARGEVWCHNNQTHRQWVTQNGVGTPTRINSVLDETITRVAAGWYFVLALDDEGRLVAWGMNNQGQLATGDTEGLRNTSRFVVPELRFVDIDAGGSFACGVDTLQRLWCWGDNTYGQLGVGDTEQRLKPVRVGADLRCP